MILRRCHPITLTRPAVPTPLDEHNARGRAAFEAKQYGDAWNAYKAAFQLEPSPIQALKTAIAAAYACPMSTAVEDLRQWLVLKRSDARRRGDLEESWMALELVLKAYEANARRSEQANATQRTEIERLEQELGALKLSVQRLETEARPRGFRKPALPTRKR